MYEWTRGTVTYGAELDMSTMANDEYTFKCTATNEYGSISSPTFNFTLATQSMKTFEAFFSYS